MGSVERIGFIGVGLMGHGIARNILEKGYPLTVMGHRNRAPVEDLVARGAREAKAISELVAESDLVFLCVTGSKQVEGLVYGEGGILACLDPGKVLVDTSTASPVSTMRIAADVAKKGASFVDAPLTRTPKEAEEGRLNVMLGGDPGTISRVRPAIETFAENIYVAGPQGAGHALKILHQYVALANSLVFAEAVACARAAEVDIATFCDVLVSGGGDSKALQRMRPYALEGDDSLARFSLSNALKDLNYFSEMLAEVPIDSDTSEAVRRTFERAVGDGFGDAPIPRLIDAVGKEAASG
ncbi:MAG: NAD(P)-dependent oxidoreductase [Rhodospirillales bacterium]|nr:NAD(P)-dependent oxidoreductase [Rhodospirillales bacterium]